MERKLASIQKILALTPIANADAIEQATVLGWSLVVKKGEFQVGDPCIFFEIDAILPEGQPWAEFMRPRGFRVKTVKLRGCLSQGLALPVTILGEDVLEVPPQGADVTEQLAIKKFELPLPSSADIAGLFPHYVPKTDEIRIQSEPGLIEELRLAGDFYITTKLDGMSVTYVRPPDGDLIVCSRNFALKENVESPSAHFGVVYRYNLKDKLPPGFAIQGELCGPGIQKNRLQLGQPDVFVYNVYDIKRARHLDLAEFKVFVQELGMKTVPIEETVWGEHAAVYPHTLEHWLERAKGLYTNTKNRKEGIVVRPCIETFSPTLKGRLSFKAINNDFLCKDED